MNLTFAAKLHLIGQCLALAGQTLLPNLGLPDHTLHLAAAILAYVQGVAGLWAVFLSPQKPDPPLIPKGNG